MAKKIGKTQAAVLRAMVEHRGSWDASSGWVWTTAAGTDRILASLVKHGVVERTGDRFPYGGAVRVGNYRITDAGRAYVEAARKISA